MITILYFSKVLFIINISWREASHDKRRISNAVQNSECGCDLSKKAIEGIIDTTFENIAKAVKKDKRFSYPDFGTFTIRKRKARTGRNPQTGEKLMIKASETVGFKPAPGLKGFL